MSEKGVQGEEAVVTEVVAAQLPSWAGEDDIVACELCGDSGGASRLLQCDNRDIDQQTGCIGARHLYCFSPPLAEPPEESEKWFCSFCKQHGFDRSAYDPSSIREEPEQQLSATPSAAGTPEVTAVGGGGGGGEVQSAGPPITTASAATAAAAAASSDTHRAKPEQPALSHFGGRGRGRGTPAGVAQRPGGAKAEQPLPKALNPPPPRHISSLERKLSGRAPVQARAVPKQGSLKKLASLDRQSSLSRQTSLGAHATREGGKGAEGAGVPSKRPPSQSPEPASPRSPRGDPASLNPKRPVGDAGDDAAAAAAANLRPPAFIRPVASNKRKADAEPLHDGWAKLPKPSMPTTPPSVQLPPPSPGSVRASPTATDSSAAFGSELSQGSSGSLPPGPSPLQGRVSPLQGGDALPSSTPTGLGHGGVWLPPRKVASIPSAANQGGAGMKHQQQQSQPQPETPSKNQQPEETLLDGAAPATSPPAAAPGLSSTPSATAPVTSSAAASAPRRLPMQLPDVRPGRPPVQLPPPRSTGAPLRELSATPNGNGRPVASSPRSVTIEEDESLFGPAPKLPATGVSEAAPLQANAAAKQPNAGVGLSGSPSDGPALKRMNLEARSGPVASGGPGPSSGNSSSTAPSTASSFSGGGGEGGKLWAPGGQLPLRRPQPRPPGGGLLSRLPPPKHPGGPPLTGRPPLQQHGHPQPNQHHHPQPNHQQQQTIQQQQQQQQQQDRRSAASSNVFASLLQDMTARTNILNHHEEQLKREAELHREQRQKELTAERQAVLSGKGLVLWSGSMRLSQAPPPAAGPGAVPSKTIAAAAAAEPEIDTLHLMAYGLANGADCSRAAGALSSNFDARIISIDEFDLGYEEAHNGAALLFGANPGDAAGVMRLGQLCRTLPARGRAIRAELPESQAWLALVPNPPVGTTGGAALLWGVFVTAAERPQPQHRAHPTAAQRGIQSHTLHQAQREAKPPLRWTDGSLDDDPSPSLVQPPGPAYRPPGLASPPRLERRRSPPPPGGAPSQPPHVSAGADRPDNVRHPGAAAPVPAHEHPAVAAASDQLHLPPSQQQQPQEPSGGAKSSGGVELLRPIDPRSLQQQKKQQQGQQPSLPIQQQQQQQQHYQQSQPHVPKHDPVPQQSQPHLPPKQLDHHHPQQQQQQQAKQHQQQHQHQHQHQQHQQEEAPNGSHSAVAPGGPHASVPGLAAASGLAAAPASAAPSAALVPRTLPAANGQGPVRLPLKGFSFSLVGYRLSADKTTELAQLMAAVRSLGAEHYRWPVQPGTVTTLLLHPTICQGAFEGNRLEFVAKEFLMKPPIQFFRGLDVLQMSARLQRRPTAREAAACELLPCGVVIITDAATIAAEPAVLKRLFGKMRQAAQNCGRSRTWGIRMSPSELDKLKQAYRRSHQKEVGQALQMFESRLAPKTEVQVAHAAVTGPTFTSNAGAAQALAAVLAPTEISSSHVADPPQLVRDAVKVAYRHMGDCRHVMLASVDAAAVATGSNQSSILAVDGLGGALDLLTSIVEHLEGTLHRRGGEHDM